MAEAALDFLNAEDWPLLPVAVQADCLRVWSRLEAKWAAAEAGLVGAFDACDGPAADGQPSVGAWLTRFTRCTAPAGRGQAVRASKVRAHPCTEQALADGAISVSYGRWIIDTLPKFAAEDRDTIEQILLEAAVAGALLEDLITIASAALRKLRPGGVETSEAQRHADRGLTVSKTLDGVGRINGDLTAEATALAETVIEALAVKTGPEDTRTKTQRRHDALVDALRRLVDSALLPQRGGTKPHLKVDIPLSALRQLPASKQAEDEWIDEQIAALARRRMHGATTRELLTDHHPHGHLPPAFTRPSSVGPNSAGPNGAGPDGAGADGADADGTRRVGVGVNEAGVAGAGSGGPAPFHPSLPGLDQGAALAGVGPISNNLAGALACDSTITPTVVGAVDHDALKAMTDHWLHHHGLTSNLRPAISDDSHLRLQQTMLRWAVQALSGPGGLACYLRTKLLDAPLTGPSILLDAGADDKTVPARLERLIRRRDKTCRFPGCDHSAELSQVHHIVPRSRGGPTNLWNLLTLCPMHHLIAVHTWGWTIHLNPDGTTTATGPDGRELQEHKPPGDPPLQAG